MNHLECANEKASAFWKYVVVLVVSFLAASLIGTIPLSVVVLLKMVKNGVVTSAIDTTNLSSLGLPPNLLMFLLMLPLVFGLFILIGFVALFHKRSYKQIINGTNKVRWNRFFVGAAFWAVLMAIVTIVEYMIDPSNFVLQFDIASFIPLLLISLLVIPFQTSFEELAFRGYLAQGVGVLTRNRWLIVLIPSILFGLLHYDNPEVKEYGFWIMMPQYISFGLIFGLISVLDDGIELAMGVHAANNIFISLFTTHASSAFQTTAVFEVQRVDPYWGFVTLLVSGVVLIAFFYKKYNWSFSVLNKKVEVAEQTQEV